MAATRHIIIAGPGRSGTTLLVRLLSALGFDTGADDLKFFEHANAGLEHTHLDADSAHIVKNPNFSWRLRELLDTGALSPKNIEWVIVPLRALDQAAASRIVRTLQGGFNAPGGLIPPKRSRRQRQRLAEITYELLEAAALYELPLIVLEYPNFATDPEYALRRLEPLLGERSEREFLGAWNSVVDPALVQQKTIVLPRFSHVRVEVMRLQSSAMTKLRAASWRLLRGLR